MGGVLYGALDPIYGVMLYKILVRQYRAIDRTASINVKRPGKTTLFARFKLNQQELSGIQKDLLTKQNLKRIYEIDLVDKQAVIHASGEKELCILPL